MEAVSSSEVLVLTYQTIQCHTSADNNLNLYCLKNLKFCIIFLLQIDYGHPSQPNFPRSTGNWWFRCNEGEKENETSTIPSTSTVVTDTTAVSTTDSNITDTDKDVTSTIPSTSTTEETPPPAGSELEYDADYITHTGIHWNWYRVVLKCNMLEEWMLLLASVFWDVRPSSVLVRYWYIQWICCLPLPDWSWYGTKFHVTNCNTPWEPKIS